MSAQVSSGTNNPEQVTFMWSYPSTDWSVTAIVPFFQRNSLQLQETVDEDLAGCQRWIRRREI